MGAPMTFEGSFCFRTSADLEQALATLGEHDGPLSAGDFERMHLMLDLRYDNVLPSAFWEQTLVALGRMARTAWLGSIECTYAEEEVEHVTAGGWYRSSREQNDRGGLTAKLRSWLSSGEKRPSTVLTESAAWGDQRDKVLVGFPPAKDYRFEFEDCTVLVIYELSDITEEPDETTPRFVYGLEDLFGCDCAPYLMEDHLHRAAARVNQARADETIDALEATSLDQLLEWIYTRRSDCLAYQLEPPPIAGDGTARAQGLEAESRPDDEDEDGEDDEPESEPWKRSGTRYVCPECGSTNTRSQYTSALGDRFTEAKCDDCGHYDSWID